MSTKLYSGLRLTAHAPDIYTLTRIISKHMREVFHELAVEVIARHVQVLVDSQKARDEAIADYAGVSLQLAAEKRWRNEQAELNRHSRLQDPLRFQIVFGETEDEHGNLLRLAYPFTGRHQYVHALANLKTESGKPIFVDFHYQDQTERPEEIPEPEWEQRRTAWDQVLHSDDPETDDTFGHLPGWALPETIEGVFGTWLWLQDGIDLSAHDDRARRMRLAVNEAAWRELGLDALSRGDDGQPDLGWLSRQVTELRQSVKTVVARPEWQDVALPKPLPSDLEVRVADLPAVYAPPAELVSAVVQHHRDGLSEQSS